MINKYFKKTLTIFLTLIFIFGLFPSFAFSQPNSVSQRMGSSYTAPSIGEIKGFNRSVLDYHFSRADRELNPDRWLSEAKLGITQAIGAWELFAGSLYENPLALNEIKNQLEGWSNKELENRFSQWLITRFFGNAAESAIINLLQMLDNIQINYSWHLDEEGNILFDDKTGDPMIIRPGEEGRDFIQDLINWRNDANESINNVTISYENILTLQYPELLAYIPDELRETMKAVIYETSTSMNTAIKKEFENIAAREENKFTSLRTRDIWSLRKKSGDEAARVFTENLIAETEEECKYGISEIKAKIEQAEAGINDLALLGEEWLQLYKEQFDKGLKAWEEAEERFFIRRIEWEQESFALFSEGIAIWQDAFDQFEKQRINWELSVRELLNAGEKLFEKISDDFNRNIQAAITEFELNMEMRYGEGSTRVKALIDMYLICASAAISAMENIECLHNYYKISGNLNPKDENYYSWLIEEIDNGNTSLAEIKKFYDMYNSYKKGALNARNNILANYADLFGTGALKDILSADVSSEDFYLDEYQIALIRAKALVMYWDKKTKIAEAVQAYAEDLSAGRMTEAEGLQALDDAKKAYNNSLADYEAELTQLNKIGNNIYEQQTVLEQLAAKMQEEEEKLNKLLSEYNNLFSIQLIDRKNYYKINFNSIYNSIAKEYKEFMDIKNDSLYKNVLEKGLALTISEYNENAEAIICLLKYGDGEDLLSLQEIKNLKLEVEYKIRMAAIDMFEDSDDLRPFNSEYSGADWYSKAKGVNLSEEEKEALFGENLYLQLIKDYNNSEKILSEWNDNSEQSYNELLDDFYYCSGLILLYNEFSFYTSFFQRECWQNSLTGLLKTLKDYKISSSSSSLPDVKIIAESIKNSYGNFIQNTAQFLFDFDMCFSSAPEWLRSEIDDWRNAFIEYSAIYALINDIKPLKDSLTLMHEFEEISSNLISLSEKINTQELTEKEIIENQNKITEAYRTLYLLDLQIQITEEWENYSLASSEEEKHWRQYLLKDYIEKNDPVLVSALSWKRGALDDALFKATYYTNRINEAFKMYSKIENVLIDDSAEINNIFYKNMNHNISMRLNSLEDKYKNIINMASMYELTKISSDELEAQLLAKENSLKNQENKYNEQRTEYFLEADKFIDIGSLYDAQYSVLKKAYENTEQKRFEYEKQDAIQRWASTSYLNTNNINLDNCKASLLKAQTVLNVLSDLYNDEKTRTYNNPQYEKLYTEYKKIFSGKLNVFEALDLLTSATEAEYAKNKSLYDNYKNSLYQLGYIDQNYKNYISDTDNKKWTVKDIITVKNGRLAFSADSSFTLTGIDEKKANLLSDYFTLSITPDNEQFKISAYEEALRGLSERMSEYFKDADKSKQWSLARDYLLYSLINSNKDITDINSYYYGLGGLSSSKEPLGKQNIVIAGKLGKIFAETNIIIDLYSYLKYMDFLENDIKYYSEAWNNLSETEKADLEFYVIITLQNDDYSKGFSKFYALDIYNVAKKEITKQNKAFDKQLDTWYLFPTFGMIRGLKDLNNKTLKKLNSTIKATNEEIDTWKKDLSTFLSNIKTNALEYKESCEAINNLEGNSANSKNIVWDDIEIVLLSIEMNKEKIAELNIFWDLMQKNSHNTYNSVYQALLGMQQFIIKEEFTIKNDMESFWTTAVEEQKTNEDDFLSIVDSYMNGTKSINELNSAAKKAYGINAASQKNHLSNIHTILLNDLSLYMETKTDFNYIFSILGGEIILLTQNTLKNKYMAEFAARVVEWNQMKNDLIEKNSEWLKTAALILEAGRTDWITSEKKMENARNQWAVNFTNEYNRVNDEWNEAYLAGLEDKERWLQKAAYAANNASSEAFLSLIGAEGERLSRFVDTREPLGLSYKAPEAQALMSELLQSSGIINMASAFGSINNITSTAASNVKRGMSGSTWDAALVRTAASDLARKTNQEIANMETVKLAHNVRVIADEAVKGLTKQVELANKSFRASMDDFFVYNGLWTKKGDKYVKDIIKGSAFFDLVISEKAAIEGYVDYDLEPIIFKTNLNEDYLASLDTLAIRIMLDNAIFEIETIAGELFGNGEDAIKINAKNKKNKPELSPGKFGAHIGYIPDVKPAKEMGSSKKSMFYNKGSGELGRMMTDYVYWEVVEARGNQELFQPMYEKRLWNDDGSWFKVPSLRTVSSIAVSIVAGCVTGGAGWAGIPVAIAIACSSELFFCTLDLALGYKDFNEVAVSFGKTLLTNTVTSVAGGIFNGVGGAVAGETLSKSQLFFSKGLTKSLMGLADSSFSKIAIQTIMTGTQVATTAIATTAINGIYYQDGKLRYNTDVFNKNYWKEMGANVLSSMAGSFVTASLTAANSGFNFEKVEGLSNLNIKDQNNLNGLLGSLVGQGVNYAMGGDFTLNLLSTSLFSKNKDGVHSGLLELHFGRNGTTMNIGTSGANASLDNIASAIRGAQVWNINTKINNYVKNEANNFDAPIALRAQYGYGDSVQIAQLMDILKGNVIFNIDENGNYYAETTRNGDGTKVINLSNSTQGLSVQEQYLLAVLIGHEAYRDGYVTSDNSLETRTAVTAHTEMALRMIKEGRITPDINLIKDIIAYNQGSDFFNRYVDASYDSSGDYWRVIMNENGYVDKVLWDNDYTNVTIVEADGTERTLSLQAGSLRAALAAAVGNGMDPMQMQRVMLASGLRFSEETNKWYALNQSAVYEPPVQSTVSLPKLGFLQKAGTTVTDAYNTAKKGFSNILNKLINRDKNENTNQDPAVSNSIPGMLPTGYDKTNTSGLFNDDYSKISNFFTHHEGVDWPTPVGTDITVQRDAIVKHASETISPSYGYYIIIQDTENPQLFYLGAHMQAISVKIGDTVKEGESVGTSGNTGFGTGAHFHLSTFIVPSGNYNDFWEQVNDKGRINVNYLVNPFDHSEKWKGVRK